MEFRISEEVKQFLKDIGLDDSLAPLATIALDMAKQIIDEPEEQLEIKIFEENENEQI